MNNFKDIKIDKNTVIGLVGGLLVVVGQIAKGISDKKTSDAKLAAAVEKIVNEKLQS